MCVCVYVSGTCVCVRICVNVPVCKYVCDCMCIGVSGCACVYMHNAAEVYPNRHGHICPICVSLAHFSYVKTLKMQQYCEKFQLQQQQAKLKGIAQPVIAKVSKF